MSHGVLTPGGRPSQSPAGTRLHSDLLNPARQLKDNFTLNVAVTIRILGPAPPAVAFVAAPIAAKIAIPLLSIHLVAVNCMDDCLIIGAGVIGLSLGYELSGHGLKVRILDRYSPGTEASWAGAGLLPPANRQTATDAYEELAGLSGELHPRWAQALRESTGIDTGYQCTGGIHLARDEQNEALLRQSAQVSAQRGISMPELSLQQLKSIEPRLAHPQLLSSLRAAYFLPDEAQLRNPRHLKALTVANVQRGVKIDSGIEVQGFDVQRLRVVSVRTSHGPLTAQNIVLCGGAWTSTLASKLGINMPTDPVRGQMVLLSSPTPLLNHIVDEGRRYLVPRPDGRLLIGSTEELVGFDKRTTAQGISELIQFALELVPELGELTIERTWSGLRPGSVDGLPYIGRLGQYDNTFVAAGHSRGGLHLSPGTAVVMSQLVRGEKTDVALDRFDPNRLGRIAEHTSAIV